ncbi:hypothetical protein [Shimia sp.]|uniref:hypothetical protein n=1 Tax=Shimia sp. TaxID=1954381 RepID=UPI0032969B5D
MAQVMTRCSSVKVSCYRWNARIGVITRRLHIFRAEENGHEFFVETWCAAKNATIAIRTTVYITVMAIPFIPGAEFGLTLPTVLRRAIARRVYLATVLSFSALAILQRGFAAFGLMCSADSIQKVADLDLRHKHVWVIPLGFIANCSQIAAKRHALTTIPAG